MSDLPKPTAVDYEVLLKALQDKCSEDIVRYLAARIVLPYAHVHPKHGIIVA